VTIGGVSDIFTSTTLSAGSAVPKIIQQLEH
jgi:hypothetical protein